MQVNWAQLIRSLTGMYIITNEANIQVYFHSALIKGLKILEKFSKEDPVGLNNAIIGLYAHKLYHEVINDILSKLIYILVNNIYNKFNYNKSYKSNFIDKNYFISF